MANYYDLLGISKGASEDEIKKAFKKASVKWHPDRWATKSETERKEAEEKFKEINEAKEVLTDPQKKAHYDQFGTMENFGQMGADMGGFGMDADDIFRMFSGRGFGGFGGFGRQNRRPQVMPGEDHRIQIQITLEDIWNGYSNRIRYYINSRCPECHGEGGTGAHDCPQCHGTGRYRQVSQTAFGQSIMETDCPNCNGTGKIVDKKCSKCNGSGFVRKEVEADINFPRFIPNGGGVEVKGKGHEAKSSSAPNGDLIAIAIYNYDQEKYAVQGNTIYELYKVPYYDAILGKDVKVKLPDGREKTVKIPRYCSDQKQITVEQGYKLIVRIDYPDHINSEEESLLKKIKELHK